MKALQKLTSCFTLCLVALGLASNLQAHDAKIIKFTGPVSVQLPSTTQSVPVTVDMLIPQGSVLTTGAGAEVYVEAFPGAVATITANTTVGVEKLAMEQKDGVVTSQEAMLDLKKGSVMSMLDPAKRDINHYSIRTPKGVAAARGTAVIVSFGPDISSTGGSTGGEPQLTVATFHGTATILLPSGLSVSVPFGQAMSQGQVTSLAAAAQSAGITVTQLLAEAVSAVAGNVAANTSAAGGADTATAVMAAVVSAASAADPANAASFTSVAVAAVTASAGATGGNAASVSAAVNAVTEAAVRAAPGQATEIAQSSSAAVVETKVTEAVNAAKASGGDTAAAAAAAQTEAAAVVTTVAQTVVNAAAAVGTTVSTSSITTAVNNGSTQGTTSASNNTNTTISSPPPAVPAPAAPSPEAPTPSAPIVTPPTPIDLPPVSADTPPVR